MMVQIRPGFWRGVLILLQLYYHIINDREIKGENVWCEGDADGGEGRENERAGAGRFDSWFPRGLSLRLNRGQSRGTAANYGEILMISQLRPP